MDDDRDDSPEFVLFWFLAMLVFWTLVGLAAYWWWFA